MKNNLGFRILLVSAALFLGQEFCVAGDFFHGRGGSCDCNRSSIPAVHAQPVLAYAQTASVGPVIQNACACTSAISGCCGVGGGMLQLGSFYGAGSVYGSGYSYHGSPAVGSFLSGYEGLPNMDGGGIHHRYPYHSYRRPWAHPGTPSTNVTIVW